mgnify:CR=1 FL=1
MDQEQNKIREAEKAQRSRQQNLMAALFAIALLYFANLFWSDRCRGRWRDGPKGRPGLSRERESQWPVFFLLALLPSGLSRFAGKGPPSYFRFAEKSSLPGQAASGTSRIVRVAHSPP